MDGFILDCNSQTTSAAIGGGSGDGKHYKNIWAKNCSTNAITLAANNSVTVCEMCEVSGQTGGISFVIAAGTECQDCWVVDPASTTGAAFSVSGSGAACIRCTGEGHASASTADVFALASGLVDGGTCYNAGRDCFRITCGGGCSGMIVKNSVAWLTVGFCFNAASGTTRLLTGAIQEDYNACGSTTGSGYNNLTAGTHNVTLSTIPFIDVSTNNFALNNTSNGGRLLKGTGFPGNTGAVGTGYQDLGGLQSQGSSPVVTGTVQ